MSNEDKKINGRNYGFEGYMNRRAEYQPVRTRRHKFLPDDIDANWDVLLGRYKYRFDADAPGDWITLGFCIFIFFMISLEINTSIAGRSLFVIIALIPIIWGIILYFKLNVLKTFYINTELGRCKCKITKRKKNRIQLLIYYEKIINQNYEKQNIFKKFKNLFGQKYSKMLVLKGHRHLITDLLNTAVKNPDKQYALNNIIKQNGFSVERVNLTHTKDKININTSNVAKLGELPFIDKQDAVKIVMHIQKNGEFSSIWDFAEFINYPQEELNTLLKYAYIEKTIQDSESAIFEENNLKGDNPKLDPTLDI